MTVANSPIKKAYVGNGTTTIWPVPFSYMGANDIVLIINDEKIDKALYKVTEEGVKYPLAGEPVAAGTKVFVYRDTPMEQGTDFMSHGGYYPEQVETGLDNIEMQLQELADQLERVITAPIDSDDFDYSLPSPVEAMSSLCINQDGKGFRYGANPDDAREALIVAQRAETTANGVDAKATEALENAEAAVVTANETKDKTAELAEKIEAIDLGNADTLNNKTDAQIIDEAVGKAKDEIGSVPLGTIITFPVENIPTGYLECNGAAVGRTTYPELFNLIGTTYGAGDGSTNFNLPDLRGEFIRGWSNGRIGVDSERKLGSSQGDAIRNITGEVASHQAEEGGLLGKNPDVSGVFAAGSLRKSRPSPQTTSDAVALKIDASLQVPTADENRPRNVAMVYCIKAFDNAVNQGLVDVAELANDIAQVSAALNDFKYDSVKTTIIYPNGGTAGSPANVTINSRYESAIPSGFEGYFLHCETQILINGKWGNPCIHSATSSVYTVQSNLFNNKIVTQTGNSALINANPALAGHPFGTVTNLTTAPCRIIVTRLGKMI